MKLYDLLVFFPRGIIASIAKTIRSDIMEESKEIIAQKKLYHFSDEKGIEAILKSGYIKPSDAVTSYGKKVAFMFGGLPTLDEFASNLDREIFPYENPAQIYNAIEIDIKKEELGNYKVRPFADSAVMYEGYCVLPNERAKSVQVVADLKRDENGEPILDENGRAVGIELRKRTREEIEQSPDEYIPKQDYLDFIKILQKEYGYRTDSKKPPQVFGKVNKVVHIAKASVNNVKDSVSNNVNYFDYFKNKLVNLFKRKEKMLDEPADMKIDRRLNEKAFLNRKNPYKDKNFAKAVGKFQQKDGLPQYDFATILKEFNNSRSGMFLREKREQIDKKPIRKNGIHGMGHMDRVAMLSLMIAEKEGILKENSTRERELLTYAAYYHDIGRIGDQGPHAKRSARKIKKLDLTYLDGKKFSDEDKKIVQLLAEGHEGNDDNIFKLFEKYEINEENKEFIRKLLYIIKDADALDRARLTISKIDSTVTDLNPDYLRLDSSRRFLETSYGLEDLTSQVSVENLLNYGNQRVGEKYSKKIDDGEKFSESLRVSDFKERQEAYNLKKLENRSNIEIKKQDNERDTE